MSDYIQPKNEEEALADNTALIVQKNKRFRKAHGALNVLGNFAIVSMIVPLIFADIFASLYQAIYFTIHDIPKIKRKDYIMVFDRGHLSKLTTYQRLSCMYCGYANGLINWIQDIAAQTEIYSCAIKHWHPAKGQDHQKNFYAYRSFK